MTSWDYTVPLATIWSEHSYLKEIGRAEYYSVTDQQALEGFQRLSQLEGIIPDLGTAHAIAYLDTLCPQGVNRRFVQPGATL